MRVAPVDEQGKSLGMSAIAEVVAAPTMAHVRALEAAGRRRGEPMCGMYGGTVATSAWLLGACSRRPCDTTGRAAPQRRHAQRPGGNRDSCVATILQGLRICSSLRHLDLSDMYTQDLFESLIEVTRVLGQASFVKNLRALSFAHCYLGDEAARHLAQAPLVKLESLDLARCEVLHPDGLSAILSAPPSQEADSACYCLRCPIRLDRGSADTGTPSIPGSAGQHGGTSSVSRGTWSSRIGRTVDDDEWGMLLLAGTEEPHQLYGRGLRRRRDSTRGHRGDAPQPMGCQSRESFGCIARTCHWSMSSRSSLDP